MIDGTLSDAFTRAWPKSLDAGFGPYRGIITSIHDGDTLTIAIDAGLSLLTEIDVRIFGCNAPELHGKTKAEGEAARDFLRGLIPPGSPVVVATLPASLGEQTRSFVRYVARLRSQSADDVASMMVAAGHAAWTDRHLKPIDGPPPFGA